MSGVVMEPKKEEESDDAMDLSDDEEKPKNSKLTSPITPEDMISNGEGLKRKREAETSVDGTPAEDGEGTPMKRQRSLTPPAPPPPPPPAEAMPEGESSAMDMEQNAISDFDHTFAGDTPTIANGEAHGKNGMVPPPPPPNAPSPEEDNFENGTSVDTPEEANTIQPDRARYIEAQ